MNNEKLDEMAETYFQEQMTKDMNRLANDTHGNFTEDDMRNVEEYYISNKGRIKYAFIDGLKQADSIPLLANDYCIVDFDGIIYLAKQQETEDGKPHEITAKIPFYDICDKEVLLYYLKPEIEKIKKPLEDEVYKLNILEKAKQNILSQIQAVIEDNEASQDEYKDAQGALMKIKFILKTW